ncbi:MAG: ATP synthase subunit I [Rhodoferax sp.]|uniref:N-ATPase subunit AtpR n=1 Tax=Rhodoferax sp. TaxID=50421 RepID=UPI0032668B8B
MPIGTWLAALAGFALGCFFFGSLWWTVRRALSSQSSALWLLGGLVVRMAVTLLGFYTVGAGHWERLIACLVGFVVARVAAKYGVQRWEQSQTRLPQEAIHAPQS